MAWYDDPDDTPPHVAKMQEFAGWLVECGAATLSVEYTGRLERRFVADDANKELGIAKDELLAVAKKDAALGQIEVRRELGKTCSDLMSYRPEGDLIVRAFVTPHLPEGWDALGARGFINVDLKTLEVKVDHKPADAPPDTP